MYLYLGLFAAIFAVGIVLGLILFIAADENKTAEENIETRGLHQQEAGQVLEETVEVVSSDDGSAQIYRNAEAGLPGSVHIMKN